MADYARTLIYIGGAYHLAFFIFHAFFWKIFRWKADLRSLSLINRQVMQILNLCLMYYFLIMGFLSFIQVEGLLTTWLGKMLLFFIALFWFFRAVLQIIFFPITKVRSLVLTVIFVLGGVIYLILCIS